MSRSTSSLGIDEAGYGPTLGPLVVGYVRVDGPPGALGRAFEAARRAVPVLPPLDDSKRLHAGGRLDRIETIALAAVESAIGRAPTLFDLIGSVNEWDSHPWYSPQPSIPLAAQSSAISNAASALTAALQAEGASIGSIGVSLVLEGPLNCAFDRLANKGTAHLEIVESTVLRAWPAGTTGRIWCDRLGGRKFYADALTRLFPFRGLDTLEEDEYTSRYIIDDGVIETGFLVNGESRAPEIALASCLAKTVREICMHSFNSYFSRLAPTLRETAGYPEDAARWLADLAGHVPNFETWRSRLVRTR